MDAIWAGVIANLPANIIGLASAGVVLYVSNRLLKQREWFREEMTKVVKENCAGKVEFEGHIKADELFQRTLLEDISVKRGEYARQHKDHYEHAAKASIHQESMSSDLLREKFENLKTQVSNVQARLERVADAIDGKT